ncbi:MAG: radical SAM protein [Deltaproteobacteria bacterium]|nr:radical SAM protein [Deltaproteobacteria bacterium]
MDKATLALLVGGRSERMGQDKGLLPVRGKPLVLRQISRLKPLFQNILIICSSLEQKKQYEKLSEYRVICDDSGNDHAAYYGLICALKNSPTQKVVVLPVDAIGVDVALLKKLLSSHPFPAAYDGTPFPSVWLKEHLHHWTADERSILNLLKELSFTELKSTACEDKLLKVNLNTPEDVRAYFGEPVQDAWGRQLNYLRLSITENCNMACRYCLPQGFPGWESAKALLSFEGISNILQAFRSLGFEKVRFTGGEPSLHPNLLPAITEARSLGYETISLTTNGSYIRNCSSLVEAGLTHINISLDTIHERTFFKITGNKHFSKVLALIDQALELKMNVRINTVVLRTQNFHEISDLLEWAKQRPLTLRFIELMPTNLHQAYFKENWVSNEEVQRMARSLGYEPSSKLDGLEPAGPALLYDHPQSPCRLGFISPLSCNFCSRCNRLRVTAQGKLRLCLFSENDLALPLQESPEVLAKTIRALLVEKQEGHILAQGHMGNVAHFRGIGG